MLLMKLPRRNIFWIFTLRDAEILSRRNDVDAKSQLGLRIRNHHDVVSISEILENFVRAFERTAIYEFKYSI